MIPKINLTQLTTNGSSLQLNFNFEKAENGIIVHLNSNSFNKKFVYTGILEDVLLDINADLKLSEFLEIAPIPTGSVPGPMFP